ncbi:DEAH-box ATP-dependent RNA helicase prp43 [Pestalotiopsis sp. IQ-011]
MSVARRVAEEMDVELGTLVGYNVRFEVKGSAQTRLGYMTDGKLLAVAMSDPLFSRYCCIVVDEAHERTIPTDLLLVLLKHAVAARHDLKIVIMSATMDASKFQSYFGGEDKAPMIHMSGIYYRLSRQGVLLQGTIHG